MLVRPRRVQWKLWPSLAPYPNGQRQTVKAIRTHLQRNLTQSKPARRNRTKRKGETASRGNTNLVKTLGMATDVIVFWVKIAQ